MEKITKIVQYNDEEIFILSLNDDQMKLWDFISKKYWFSDFVSVIDVNEFDFIGD